MILRFLHGIQRRWTWAKIGVYFARARDFQPRQLTLAGKPILLRFPTGEEDGHRYELGEIYAGDCYKLRGLENVRTIVDIGANIGLFSMIARHHFPHARIDAYEPNPGLREIIHHHLELLQVTIYQEAVGLADTRASMIPANGSLHHLVKTDPQGDVTVAGVRTVLDRIGGTIDLLKMDCEGGEWEILQSDEFMRSVRTLTMEYHPREPQVPVLNELILLLRKHQFHRVEIHQRVDESWGLLHASRS
jgi:FkbM family methyltransferase